MSAERGRLNSESKQAVRASFIYNAGGGKPQRSGSGQNQQHIRVTVHELVSVTECSTDVFIHAPRVWSLANAFGGRFLFERVFARDVWITMGLKRGLGMSDQTPTSRLAETTRTSCGKTLSSDL